MSKANRNLHILIIPSWYPRFNGDIGGSFFREQALALKKSGHKVGVIYPQFRSIKDIRGVYSKPYGIQYINDNGLQTFKYHHLSVPKFHELQKRRWINTGLKLFKQYTEKFGFPDIIHIHSLNPAGYLALKIKSHYGIPFIVTEHSTTFARGLVDSKEIIKLDKVVKSSNYNIAVSQPFADLLTTTFKHSEWHYIPNIVNDAFLSVDNHLPSNEFIFLSVSLLTEKKAIDNLIKAFSMVNKVLPNTILHIGGDGSDRVKLQDLVNDLQLDDKVKFLGNLPRERVKTEMSICSVFVLPSRYETFGVVAVEALALGKPVIATKCGGPESIIVNDNIGTLVEVDDVTALSDAMIDTYINYSKYNSKDIREYCIDNFSEEAVTSKLTSVYHSILTVPN